MLFKSWRSNSRTILFFTIASLVVGIFAQSGFVTAKANVAKRLQISALSDESITAESYTVQPVPGKDHTISLHFDEATGQKIANITKAHLGQHLAIIVDGKVIATPHVRAPLTDGSRIEISVDSESEMTTLNKMLAAPKK